MYPIDRRKVAQQIYDCLQSLRKTSKLMHTSHSTISRWLKNPSQKPRKKTKLSKSDKIVSLLRSIVSSQPFISINEIQETFKTTLELNVSRELIRVAIKKLNFTKKKAKFYGRPNNLEEKTKEFLLIRNKYLQEGKNFFSIDETSFGRNGIITKGYSPKGEKLYIRKTFPRMTTLTSIVCISQQKLISEKRHVGSVNKDVFLDFLKGLNLPKDSVILMDNVRFHHCHCIKEYLKNKSINILYTPPYSPWFNPIEMCFSIIKRTFYKNNTIDNAFESLSERHIKSFFLKSLSISDYF